MPDITTRHLQAAIAVLTRRVSLEQVAIEYNLRFSAVTAVAILWCAGWREASYKGEFGDLLRELVVEPGSAKGGPMYEQKAAWWSLVTASGKLHLHASRDRGGNGVYLDPPDQIRRLADDHEFVTVALVYYRAARNRVLRRREDARDYRRRERLLLAAMRRHQLIAPVTPTLASWLHSPYRLAQFHSALGALLAQYFPEYMVGGPDA